MKRSRLLGIAMTVVLMCSTCVSSVQAYPYYYGGYRGGYCGYGGWYGSGIPNGLGWTIFGVSAAAILATITAPLFSRPVYAVPPPGTYYYQRPPRIQTSNVSTSPSTHPSSQLAKAQSKLTELGYYKGVADGSYGSQTRQAIQLFQTDNRLPVSGQLDLKTLSCLGIVQ